MCKQVRGEHEVLYYSEPGKSCSTEIRGALMAFNAKGRSIWKPMHLQLIYRNNVFITTQSVNRRRSNVYIDEGAITDNGRWLFKHGLYLPSDNKMIDDQVDLIIKIVKRCFD